MLLHPAAAHDQAVPRHLAVARAVHDRHSAQPVLVAEGAPHSTPRVIVTRHSHGSERQVLKLCNQELLVVDLDADKPPEPSISLPFDIASALERAIIFSTNVDSTSSRRMARSATFRYLADTGNGTVVVGKKQSLCHMESDNPVRLSKNVLAGEQVSHLCVCNGYPHKFSGHVVFILSWQLAFRVWSRKIFTCKQQNDLALTASEQPFRLPAPPPSADTTVTFKEAQRIRLAFVCAVCSIIRKIPLPLPITKQ